MAVIMKTVTGFYNEDGTLITESERTANVPGIEEIEKEGFRAAFHQLEGTVLETTNSTRNAAVSGLMEELSKKKTESECHPGTIIEKKYTVQGELGVLGTKGHKLINGKQTIYDSTEAFFEKTGPREAFKSNLFKELSLYIATKTSIRNGAALLNRMRRSDKGIIPMTFANFIEREGEVIQRCIEEKTMAAIEEKGFSVEADGTVIWKASGERVKQCDIKPNQEHINEETVHEAAKRLKLNEGSYNPSDYEKSSVNISSDDVGVKRQTESRPSEEGKTQPKRVENTVIHVEMANASIDPKESSSSSYILNSSSVSGAFKLLLGFLCMNRLFDKTLVFFVDGARNLNTAIAAMFSFANIKIILDWYHLSKKMEETLSRICNNRVYRNEMLQKIMPLLWRGDVDGAISMLKSIDMRMVKDSGSLNYIAGYLERVRKTIPNYMLRAQLGLRNSSNRGEKSNDLIVSNRQKHNGMSWSDAGSVTLASVSAALHNGELDNWVEHRTLSLKMIERLTPKRPRRNRKRTEVAYSNVKTNAVAVVAA